MAQASYAPYLRLALACENNDQAATALGLSAEEINAAHLNALVWSEGLDL